MPRATGEGFRIDVDLDHARREADRVRDMLQALRRRHDLSRFEYTRVVRIVPGGDTFSHPMLTLGNRFAENEDLLLSTYLHEQMHWYLWHLGTPEQRSRRAVLRRAGAALSGGARPSCPTGRATTSRPTCTSSSTGSRWRPPPSSSAGIAPWRWPRCSAPTAGSTAPCCRDWDALQELYERHGLVPIRSAAGAWSRENAKAAKRALNGGARKNPAAARAARVSSIPP